MNAIAIFDIGKTNKKAYLLDEGYHVIWENSVVLEASTDEDGDPCEDLLNLMDWIYYNVALFDSLKDPDIRAVNFAAYGASFVHIGKGRWPVAPLYNYLKPYPETLLKKFYQTYGGESKFSQEAASPVLGSLNSGLQLYRIKEERPDKFREITYSLHLPQYLSFLFTGQAFSNLTSIGCHTNLWDFDRHAYHEWVSQEGVLDKLAPIAASSSVWPIDQPVGTTFTDIPLAGIGLHDSSAALIPYQETRREPFALLSTGTWCITLNPFNHAPLTADELQNDCLCYLDYQGRPVKASRLFAGYEHEQQVLRLADRYHKSPDYTATVAFDPGCNTHLQDDEPASFEQAYHLLMQDIIEKQAASTRLVLQGAGVGHLYVDGGFANNKIYMHLLARAFPEMEVFAAALPQATALGAALVIHEHWNTQPRPQDMIGLIRYSPFTP
jgi:sugar (pentulose or hexulose) kinase